MKTSAIIRIVVFSLLLLLLTAILIGGLGIDYFINNLISGNSNESGEQITSVRQIDDEKFSKLEIEWAAGSVEIVTGYKQDIVIKETKDTSVTYAMVTEIEGSTLKISYGKKGLLNLGATPEKDLLVIIPKDWDCRELEINGAALDIDITGMNIDNMELNGTALDIDISMTVVENMELNGASAKLTFNGSVSALECNGAATKMDLTFNDSPKNIAIDGAACELKMKLPKDCGFVVDPDGLAIEFQSNCPYNMINDKYCYGNEYCKIDVSGLSCKVTIDPS